MTRYILSSVGTSLLTNNAGSLTTLLRDTANLREAELSAEHAITSTNASAPSAFSFPPLTWPSGADAPPNLTACTAPLLPTARRRRPPISSSQPTLTRAATAGLLRDYLEGQGITSVQVEVPDRLSTRSQADFTAGIRKVVRFCEETFGPCREAHVPVLFNLVGSFKSLQGQPQHHRYVLR